MCVTALFQWLAFKRESAYTAVLFSFVFFLTNRLFQNVVVVEHKFIEQVFCPGVDKSMFNYTGKSGLKPQCYSSGTRPMERVQFGCVGYRALQRAANV